MNQLLVRGAVCGIAIVACAAPAFADVTYNFSVPYSVSLPAGYTGDKVLSLRCAIGPSGISFNPSSGSVGGVGDNTGAGKYDGAANGMSKIIKVTLGGNGSAGVQNTMVAESQQQSQSQSQQMAALQQSMVGTSQKQAAATYTGTADAAVTFAGNFSTAMPTTYLCWGVMGKSDAYVTTPVVKGTLPVFAR